MPEMKVVAELDVRSTLLLATNLWVHAQGYCSQNAYLFKYYILSEECRRKNITDTCFIVLDDW